MPLSAKLFSLACGTAPVKLRLNRSSSFLEADAARRDHAAIVGIEGRNAADCPCACQSAAASGRLTLSSDLRSAATPKRAAITAAASISTEPTR
jgi:hypothetical protein